MATLNYAFKELSCKIVYYGCGLCGKTTNLIHIHKTVPQKFRGELVSLATEQDRTLFFDFLPLDLGEVRGFKTKFQLYTVPGQVYYNATRKLVLRGVDGLVFVADSQRDRFQENIDSLENLKQNLAEYGYHLQNGPGDTEGIPWVLQYNKRDMPQVSSIEEMNQALNSGQVPIYEAVAVSGGGVKDTLKGISSLVIKKLNADSSGPPAPEPKSGASKSAVPVAAASSDYEELTAEERRKLERGEDIGESAPAPAPAAAAPAPAKKLPEPKAAPAPAPAAAPTAPAAPAASSSSGAPKLNVVAQNKALLRGLGLGNANLTLANFVGGDDNQFQLTGKVTFLGIFGSTWSRTLRYEGTETKNADGGSAKFYKFTTSDNATPAVTVYVKDDHDKHLYASYIGGFGEVQIVPPGKKPLA